MTKYFVVGWNHNKPSIIGNPENLYLHTSSYIYAPTPELAVKFATILWSTPTIHSYSVYHSKKECLINPTIDLYHTINSTVSEMKPVDKYNILISQKRRWI